MLLPLFLCACRLILTCMGLFTSLFSLLSYVGPLLINCLLQLMSVLDTVKPFTEVFYEDI